MLYQDPDHAQKLLEIYQRRQQLLEIQIATYGLNPPTHLLLELEDVKNQIKILSNPQAKVAAYDNLQFQNQLDAINAVLRQNQIGNFVIDAPAGYGKTYLLLELKNRLLIQKWHARIISFRDCEEEPANQRNAITFICANLGVSSDGDAEDIGAAVANALREMSDVHDSQISFNGSFLILDTIEYMFKDRGETPYRDIKAFILGINQASATFKDFRVRVLLAGRYIVDDRLFALDAPRIPLKIFDISVVQQAVTSYLEARSNTRQPQWNEQFALHAMYITGGHPLMLKKLLVEEYSSFVRKPDLEKWIDKLAIERIKAKIIRPTIADLRKDIPEGDALWDDLLKLSVFRKFNNQILRELFPNRDEKPFQYADRLERYGLVTRDDAFYKDGVLRPAMVRWLQFTDFPKLSQCCLAARNILLSWLQQSSNSGFRPPVIVRELLYIHLLELHNVALDTESGDIQRHREQLQATMLKYVSQLRDLSKDADIVDELIYDLRRALQSDEEIYFLYNYIFRSRPSSPSRPPEYAQFVLDLCEQT